MTTFDTLGLREELVSTVAGLGYDTPTPIQEALVPLLLQGRDVVGQAQTGTGKTAAFTLPMLQRLAENGGEGTARAPRALVLAPTRELAVQVASAVHTYGKTLGARVLPVYGGQPYHKQTSRLERGVDVVVGTPGRLIDLMTQGALDLSAVQVVVLDEADEMLSMGFAEDLETILDATPAERQTALLSATMPAGIRRIATRYLREPESVVVGAQHRAAAAIAQRFYLVREHDKPAALARLLEVEPVEAALVFVRTRAETAAVAEALQAAGFAAEALSGELSQAARTDVLGRLRSRRIQVLVATDVAARGLDVEHVSHVFNLDLPRDPEVYVHRVGRTGRAGRTGVAVALVAPHQRGLLRRIEDFTRQPVEQAVLPTPDEVRAHRETALRAALAERLPSGDEDTLARERALVLSLLAEGHDPLDLAAAAVALARRDEAEIAPVAEVRDRPRPERAFERRDGHRPGNERFGGNRSGNERGGFGRQDGRGPRGFDRRPTAQEEGMVRLALNTGHMHGVRPGQIVGALAHFGEIPGSAIGRITIDYRQTWVDVPEALAPQVLARSGRYQIGRNKIEVERA